MGKFAQAASLLKQCLTDAVRADGEKTRYALALSILHSGSNEFDSYIDAVDSGADKALSQSIHKLRVYCQQVVSEDLQEAIFLDQACNYVDEGLNLAPTTKQKAQLLSQKAHIIRMQGKPERQWQALFTQSSCLDPSRVLKEKSEPWRELEHRALETLNIMY